MLIRNRPLWRLRSNSAGAGHRSSKFTGISYFEPSTVVSSGEIVKWAHCVEIDVRGHNCCTRLRSNRIDNRILSWPRIYQGISIIPKILNKTNYMGSYCWLEWPNSRSSIDWCPSTCGFWRTLIASIFNAQIPRIRALLRFSSTFPCFFSIFSSISSRVFTSCSSLFIWQVRSSLSYKR